MWRLKTITQQVIVTAQVMIMKGTNKHNNKIPSSSSLYEIQKNLFFVEWSTPQESSINVNENNNTQKRQQKWTVYNRCLSSCSFLVKDLVNNNNNNNNNNKNRSDPDGP